MSLRADQRNSWEGGQPYARVRLPDNTGDLFLSWWIYFPEYDNVPGEGTSEPVNWKNIWILGSDQNHQHPFHIVRETE